MLIPAGVYESHWAGLNFPDPVHYPALMYFDGEKWINPSTGRPGNAPTSWILIAAVIKKYD